MKMLSVVMCLLAVSVALELPPPVQDEYAILLKEGESLKDHIFRFSQMMDSDSFLIHSWEIGSTFKAYGVRASQKVFSYSFLILFFFFIPPFSLLFSSHLIFSFDPSSPFLFSFDIFSLLHLALPPSLPPSLSLFSPLPFLSSPTNLLSPFSFPFLPSNLKRF